MSNIPKNVLLESKKSRIKEAFQLMDMDSDGHLDYYETKVALRALGLTAKKSFVLSIMRMYDKHGDNKICFDDFCYVALQKLSTQSICDEAKYVFKLFTEESTSDKITLEDLQRINKKIDCNLTLEEMELMIKEFDLDQDNSINETEFLEIMTTSRI